MCLVKRVYLLFSLGEEFHNNWNPFLGDGIFNVDGEKWSMSRHLLRPHFHKERVSDLECFEHHITTLLDLLPKDGSPVDMKSWLFRFTLDAATDFLFGEVSQLGLLHNTND